ncbi:MAG: GAF domain-containing protein, partial [Anaerolineae bacterium]|nr:GAF domain-containing protein [Anaerolineae bacterium]
SPINQRRPPVAALRALDILISQTAYIVENARLLAQVSESAETLADQVEELSMMHRADRELSTHLDVERIMRLTMDWALRRTGASTGLLMLTTRDRRGLVPSVTMGYIDHDMFPYNAENPFPLSMGVIGRAARTGQTQLVRDVKADKDYVPFIPDARTYVSIPLLMRGEPLGVLTLASSRVDAFDGTDVSFLERLARRAAVAFDNARLFRQSEQLADDMAVLYTATRTISSTLERDEVLQRIAQAIAVVLECSSAVIFDYQLETAEAQVLAVYRLGTAYDAQEVLPEVKHKISVRTFPAFEAVLEQQHPLVLRVADSTISHLDRQHLLEDKIHTMVLMPLIAQDEMIGLVVVMEGRHDRTFTPNEVFKAETLASQAALALRQSMLYSEVLELERLKSEMIRMASHDLRNPLNNIMGYVELLAMTLQETGVSGDEMLYIDNLRRSSRVMRSLLEDLLTLERIESERESEWQIFDLGGLVTEVVMEHQQGADLKKQTLVFDRPREVTPLFGSVTQMRQAVSNLVGNAIKYTPADGRVEVQLVFAERRLDFKVIDNGYGISEDRQKRIFERFYRAQEPGTNHISGTGLGLSLVKTVVERHGGQVWFKSTPGAGSTFGFWVPAGDE